MKNFTKLTILFTLLFAACTTDTTSDILADSGGKTIIIEASLEGARTTLSDNGAGGKVAWSKDDSISAITADGKITRRGKEILIIPKEE